MQMKVPQFVHGYPSDARSSLLQDRQIIASRSRRIWRIQMVWDGALGMVGARLRIAESISRAAFDNALRGLKQRRKSIRSGLLPTRRHRGEAPLLSLTLEAEPSVAVLARDFHVSSERALAPLRGATPIGKALKFFAPRSCCRATVDFASFGCCRSHQPNLPPLTRRIEKRPITHADPPSPVSAPRSS